MDVAVGGGSGVSTTNHPLPESGKGRKKKKQQGKRNITSSVLLLPDFEEGSLPKRAHVLTPVAGVENIVSPSLLVEALHAIAWVSEVVKYTCNICGYYMILTYN
ncbi:hypothetical protein HOY80DRAFT_1029646 [Tuber brumale]|nr:hypothetical protein HOY80DRAFT_1029646 [Tuber brumale]